MALPQQVINQMSNEKPETPGWFSGVLLFAVAIFVVVLAIYFGLLFIYQPYLNNSLNNIQNQVATESQAISSGDETQLLNFYSQTVNLQSLLGSHILFSQFLTWLEHNTQVNVHYTQFTFASNGAVTLTVNADSEADAVQQMQIFASAPDVQNLAIGDVQTSATGWSFPVTLKVNSAVVLPGGTSTSTSS